MDVSNNENIGVFFFFSPSHFAIEVFFLVEQYKVCYDPLIETWKVVDSLQYNYYCNQMGVRLTSVFTIYNAVARFIHTFHASQWI